jgi:hypothetical protein
VSFDLANRLNRSCIRFTSRLEYSEKTSDSTEVITEKEAAALSHLLAAQVAEYAAEF